MYAYPCSPVCLHAAEKETRFQVGGTRTHDFLSGFEDAPFTAALVAEWVSVIRSGMQTSNEFESRRPWNNYFPPSTLGNSASKGLAPATPYRPPWDDLEQPLQYIYRYTSLIGLLQQPTASCKSAELKFQSALAGIAHWLLTFTQQSILLTYVGWSWVCFLWLAVHSIPLELVPVWKPHSNLDTLLLSK